MGACEKDSSRTEELNEEEDEKSEDECHGSGQKEGCRTKISLYSRMLFSSSTLYTSICTRILLHDYRERERERERE